MCVGGEGEGGAFILYFFFSFFFFNSFNNLKLDFSKNRGNVRYPNQDVDSNGKNVSDKLNGSGR